jgi:hypothetical protein
MEIAKRLAPAEAVIAAPGNCGAYWEAGDGKRQYDEGEFLVDGRRLQRVIVARRYPQLSHEEWTARESNARHHRQKLLNRVGASSV